MKRSSLLSRLERSTLHTTSVPRAPSSETSGGVAAIVSPLPDPKSSVLDRLRQKMAEVMGQPVAPTEVRRNNFGELPLLRREHTSGPLWHRVVPVPLEYRVGHRTCHDVLDNNWAQVALLALSPDLVDVNPSELLFLDTETTGFGGAGTLAFLVGLSYLENGRFVVEQLMLEGPEQEATLLGYLQQHLERRPVVVSFNGKSFDWPLLQGRYTMNRLSAPSSVRHLDLLHLARRVHKRRLGRCNLQRLEAEVLGFERLGDIDGAEVAARYTHYCRSQDASPLAAVIEHNYWDVLSMVALLGVYGAASLALPAVDLAGAASTLARASALTEALMLADRGLSLVQESEEGWRQLSLVRAEIRKALGDKSGAVADYEAAIEEPKARLELAKLYEHYLKDHERAWALVQRGTSEAPAASAKRAQRLEKKRSARP